MKKITINNEATIKAKGELTSGNCDPTIILENGMAFTSQVDLAAYLGVSSAAVSSAVCGRSKTCKGYHIVSVSRLAEGVDVLLTRLRETSAMEEDAKKWQAYQAEQEAARKAEERRLEEERKAREKHEAEVEKARAKIAKLTENCNNLEAKLLEEERALMEAEAVLANLLGENQQVA